MARNLVVLLAGVLVFGNQARAEESPAADVIVHNARVVTFDPQSRTARAVAVRQGRIVAIGDDAGILKQRGPDTRVIDAGGQTLLPGLYDSHVHPLGAATSELTRPVPLLRSLKDVFAHIRERVKTTPEGEWIVLYFAFPTRLDEARFPTKAELDEVAPKHPVLYHAGPAGIANSEALKVCGVTKDTPNPPGGVIVKDPTTGEPTGMLRGSYRPLKGLPAEDARYSADQKRSALKKLFALYNEQGLTSIADRNGSREALDLYLDLHHRKELTLRVNVARSFDPSGTREQVVRRLEELPGKDGLGGPTGKGDEMVRIGPIKLFLDGGMLNGTAYMRQPWPKGETYQITEDGYRGLLFLTPDQLKMVLEEGVRRKWQMTAHTAGEGAMDVLMDAYEQVNRMVPIKDLRCCITHANFPSKRNLELCRDLGVCADVQPAWLWKDGATLHRVLGDDRVRWFQPYKTWMEYTTIGGGSDHMIRLDSLDAVNPWNPWLALWTTLTRKTERGAALMPEEALSREQAIRLYTINNAYLHNEEKWKGSLQVGKVADMILIDRDVMTCPVDEVRKVLVLWTMVDGKLVYQRKP
jgi:predicted amidohydrolase YtcJ